MADGCYINILKRCSFSVRPGVYDGETDLNPLLCRVNVVGMSVKPHDRRSQRDTTLYCRLRLSLTRDERQNASNSYHPVEKGRGGVGVELPGNVHSCVVHLRGTTVNIEVHRH